MLTNVVFLLAGVACGCLVTTSLIFPRVARAVAKSAAVILMGTGVGFLTLGLFSALATSDFETVHFGPILANTAAQALGWGGGCLTAGIISLILTAPRKLAPPSSQHDGQTPAED